MLINSNQLNSFDYVILSYDRQNKGFEKELMLYNDEGLCYWCDKSMVSGSEAYNKQFFKALDHINCVGIIFFISERFFLSEECIEELNYYVENHLNKNKDKKHLFVVPQGFNFHNKKFVYAAISDYADQNFEQHEDLKNKSPQDRIEEINKRINSVWSLTEQGKAIYGLLGKTNEYLYKTPWLEKAIRVDEPPLDFGFFPQNNALCNECKGLRRCKFCCKANNMKTIRRALDNTNSYYAPVKWIVVSKDDNSYTLLSEKLLFSVEYLDVKYHYPTNENHVKEIINNLFNENFKLPNNEIINFEVRFLHEFELKNLILRQTYKDDKHKLYYPEVTFFSQSSMIKNIQKYWLAGDIENAQRVDIGLEGLSKKELGTGAYYIRVVINVSRELVDSFR